MAFKFDKLWELLTVRNITKDELRNEIGASQTTIVNLGKNKNLSLDIIDRICQVLQCYPTDIMDYTLDVPTQLELTYHPKHGDIFNVNLLDDGRVRPAIVLQNQHSLNEPFVMIIPLSTIYPSRNRDISLPVTVEPTEKNGLTATSYARVNDLKQVKKYQLVNKVGRMDKQDMLMVKHGVETYLGLLKDDVYNTIYDDME